MGTVLAAFSLPFSVHTLYLLVIWVIWDFDRLLGRRAPNTLTKWHAFPPITHARKCVSLRACVYVICECMCGFKPSLWGASALTWVGTACVIRIPHHLRLHVICQADLWATTWYVNYDSSFISAIVSGDTIWADHLCQQLFVTWIFPGQWNHACRHQIHLPFRHWQGSASQEEQEWSPLHENGKG